MNELNKWKENDKENNKEYVKKFYELLKQELPQCQFTDINFSDSMDYFEIRFPCERPKNADNNWKYKKAYASFYFDKDTNKLVVELATVYNGYEKSLGRSLLANHSMKDIAEAQVHNMKVVLKYINENSENFFYFY